MKAASPFYSLYGSAREIPKVLTQFSQFHQYPVISLLCRFQFGRKPSSDFSARQPSRNAYEASVAFLGPIRRYLDPVVGLGIKIDVDQDACHGDIHSNLTRPLFGDVRYCVVHRKLSYGCEPQEQFSLVPRPIS
jgi:hypothetical protein